MNEQIRVLSIEAGKYVNTLMIDYLDLNDELYAIKWNQEYSEKFAELIVQECMTQIEEVKRIQAGNAGPEYTQGFDDGMFVAIRTIEEHFGVEE